MTPTHLGDLETHLGPMAVYEVPDLLLGQAFHKHAYVAFSADLGAVALVTVNVPRPGGDEPVSFGSRNRDPLRWDGSTKEVQDVYATANGRERRDNIQGDSPAVALGQFLLAEELFETISRRRTVEGDKWVRRVMPGTEPLEQHHEFEPSFIDDCEENLQSATTRVTAARTAG